jgi:hypothetical protein
MNSKTVKALDKAFVKFEKEFERVKLLMNDFRADVQKRYGSKPKKP